MTGSEERMRQGFAELLEKLRIRDAPDYRKTIRANTAAREAAQARVVREYAEARLEPPEDLSLALSLTAIYELGYRVPIDHPAGAYQGVGE